MTGRGSADRGAWGRPRPAPPAVPGTVAGYRPIRVRVGHLLGITSPRRAAILAVVACATALSVAVPLRNYVAQRSELAAVHEQREALADEVAELERRRALLEDPRHVEAQARERLGYVRVGETPYVVQLPAEPVGADAAARPDHGQPWFGTLWEQVAGG